MIGIQTVQGIFSALREKRADYCYREKLELVGNNGLPEQSYPLGLCQGDCDSDQDCWGNLKCFQRDGTEEVPDCPGLGKSGSDYCFDDKSISNVQLPSTLSDPYGPINYIPGDIKVELYE